MCKSTSWKNKTLWSVTIGNTHRLKVVTKRSGIVEMTVSNLEVIKHFNT